MTNELAIRILTGDVLGTSEQTQEAIKMAVKALSLTSAEPEPQWIPCSERLPEEIGTYMTTLDYGAFGLAVGQRFYHGGVLGWEDDCVIAWMPLPKPYERIEE